LRQAKCPIAKKVARSVRTDKAKTNNPEMESEEEGAVELFNRILTARGEARTRSWLNHTWEKIQAHAGASQVQAEGQLMWTFNPQLRASLLLLLWQKKSNEGDPGKESLTKAKLAALSFNSTKSLQWCLPLVWSAIQENDKQFFIDFGRCLSGETSAELFDKYNRDVAEIVLQLAENPGMPTSAGVRELHKRGHTGMTNDNLRNWKKKLLTAKPEFDETIKRMNL
jgi:hypothetical protein